MGVKQCELCDRPARMLCESDQASLCWECDARVHGANFLVARHTRCLLCRSCQSPTPWRAEGARLGPTVSVCERCAAADGAEDGDGGQGKGCGVDDEGGEGKGEEREVDEDDDEEDDGDEGEEDTDADADEDEGDDDDDEGENQVVPWSMTPPPVASSSSGEESGRMGNGGGFLKRMRENVDLGVSQEATYRALTPAAANDEATSFGSASRSSNDRKRPALLRPSTAEPSVS
ncbi:unnamed protein product [Musa hybrid cultivar]